MQIFEIICLFNALRPSRLYNSLGYISLRRKAYYSTLYRLYSTLRVTTNSNPVANVCACR